MEEETLDYKKIASKVLAGVLAAGLAVPSGLAVAPETVKATYSASTSMGSGTVYLEYGNNNASGTYANSKSDTKNTGKTIDLTVGNEKISFIEKASLTDDDVSPARVSNDIAQFGGNKDVSLDALEKARYEATPDNATERVSYYFNDTGLFLANAADTTKTLDQLGSKGIYAVYGSNTGGWNSDIGAEKQSRDRDLAYDTDITGTQAVNGAGAKTVVPTLTTTSDLHVGWNVGIVKEITLNTNNASGVILDFAQLMDEMRDVSMVPGILMTTQPWRVPRTPRRHGS